LIASIGDKFIIRLYSPVVTIGGGEVIETELNGKWKYIREKINFLYKLKDNERFRYRIEIANSKPFTKSKIALKLGLSHQKIENIVSNDNQLKWINYKTSVWLLSLNQLDIIYSKINTFLENFHRDNPYKSGAQKEQIRHFLNSDDNFCDYLLMSLSNQSIIKNINDRWSLYRFSIKLSDNENKLLQALIIILEKEGFTSSRYNELAKKLKATNEQVLILLNIAEQNGDLLRLDGSLMFTRTNFLLLKEKVLDFFDSKTELSVVEFKELAKTSRKYAVPLLEYFDKQKITYRDGNVRKLV